MSYTKGPWTNYNRNVHAGNKWIAHLPLDDFSLDEQAGNGRLIAAAPELLAALKDILPVYRLWVPMATDLTQWKNALDVIDRAERSRSKVARQVKITEYESINRSATRYAVEDILSGEFIRENFMSREDAESFAAKNGWTVIAAKAEGRSDV